MIQEEAPWIILSYESENVQWGELIKTVVFKFVTGLPEG